MRPIKWHEVAISLGIASTVTEIGVQLSRTETERRQWAWWHYLVALLILGLILAGKDKLA